MVNGVHRVVIPPGETEYPEPDAFSSPPPRTPAPLAWPAATASGPPRQLRHVLLCPEASGSPCFDLMFTSPQNSYNETLVCDVMARGGGAPERGVCVSVEPPYAG